MDMKKFYFIGFAASLLLICIDHGGIGSVGAFINILLFIREKRKYR